MGPDGADRIAIGSSVLDLHPLHGVRIVAAPGLRGIGQHAGVKPCAAAGTGFEQYHGELRGQPPVEVINAQDITMGGLSLAVRRQRRRPAFGHAPVHIPLNIGNL